MPPSAPPPAAPAPARRFAVLYAAQFAAMGVMMPFLPALLAERGLDAPAIAALLGAGSALRLAAGPAGCRVADATGRARRVLAAGALFAALGALVLAAAGGAPAALLAGLLLLSGGLAPVVPLTDALALRAARGGGLDYGTVRALGSLAFLLAAAGAGPLAARAGAGAIVWPIAVLLLMAAASALRLPAAADAPPAPPPSAPGAPPGGVAALLRRPAFRRLLWVSGAVQASHALYYAFGTLHWQAAGLSPTVIGLLWAEGVAAEVVLFARGRALADRLGPAGLAVLAALAGALRWALTAQTTWLPALVALQLLHAFSFGAMHLAAMRLLVETVPAGRAATGQALHASLGVGVASLLVTLASGPLYAALGGAAWWAMAGLCAAALPAAMRLGRT